MPSTASRTPSIYSSGPSTPLLTISEALAGSVTNVDGEIDPLNLSEDELVPDSEDIPLDGFEANSDLEDNESVLSEFPDDLSDTADDPAPPLSASLEHLASVEYDTLDQLHTSLQAYASSKGFAIVRERSDTTNRYRCTFRCVCSGLHRSTRPHQESIRLREAKTIRSNCPFALQARSPPPGPGRAISWDFQVTNALHNHPPIANISLAILRQASRTPEVERVIRDQVDIGLKAASIVELLRRNHPSVLVTHPDIHRLAFRHRHTQRVGHRATEAIIDKLRDDGELFRPYLNDQRQLIGLIYTTPSCRGLLHRYPTVLFIDATYRTNKYRLPMLHICGFTSTNQTFTAGVAFTLTESEAWCDLALTAFNELTAANRLPICVIITDRAPALMNAVSYHYPRAFNMLCLWHLGENVKTNCKPAFQPQTNPGWKLDLKEFRTRWMALVVSATSEEVMVKGMETLRSFYPLPQHRIALDYAEELLAVKHRYVHYLTDRHRHLGQRTNSRLEGNHRTIKHYLQTHNSDLYNVITRIRTYIDEQLERIRVRIGEQRLRIPLSMPRVMIRLRGQVSRKAIETVKVQMALANKLIAEEQQEQSDTSSPITRTCEEHFSTSQGLPCCHQLKRMILSGKLLSVNDIHSHWRLREDGELDKWILAAADRVGEVDTFEEVLPNEYNDLQDDEDDEIILNPPLQRARRPLVRSTLGDGSQSSRTASTGRTSTGRLMTQSERAMGPQRKKPRCPCGRQHEPSRCDELAVIRDFRARKRRRLVEEEVVSMTLS